LLADATSDVVGYLLVTLCPLTPLRLLVALSVALRTVLFPLLAMW
jgi:hypothetical protein